MVFSWLKGKVFGLSRWQKRLIMMAADCVFIPFAVWASYALRLGSWTPELGDGVWLLILAPLVSIPVFIRLGLYRAVIRYLGSQALKAVVIGISLSVAGLLAATALFDLQGVPRSVFIIYWGTAVLFVGGSRHYVRRLYYHIHPRARRTNVVIYGAGNSGAQLAHVLANSHQYCPVLLVDDDVNLQKSFVHGLKVYSPDELPALIKQYQLKQLLLAMPSAELSQRREVLHKIESLPIHVRTIPDMAALISGSPIEELQEIEIDDLLGRTPVAPDKALLAQCIRGKNVMVTGAGGSIGSELCRQIVREAPTKLVLFEISEFSLYQIERELVALIEHEGLEVELVPALGSVQNQVRVSEVTLHGGLTLI